jgi:hypothetical protein
VFKMSSGQDISLHEGTEKTPTVKAGRLPSSEGMSRISESINDELQLVKLRCLFEASDAGDDVWGLRGELRCEEPGMPSVRHVLRVCVLCVCVCVCVCVCLCAKNLHTYTVAWSHIVRSVSCRSVQETDEDAFIHTYTPKYIHT